MGISDSTTRRRGHARTRQEAALAWTASHVIELCGVALPLVGGFVWTPWIDVIAGVVAALWVQHEVVLHRRTAAARAAHTKLLNDIPTARLTSAAAKTTVPATDNPGSDETSPAEHAGTEPADDTARARREVSR
ncbi:hypothetical protein [Amycolatopsis sp. FDAARGOS 1241]|uniref:hypothetical protein n=1 Tax=Amycolatopsis sp. FDAARGOS 1241 TaxID=2778070 RepID=UPI001950D68C|nr:hypothetical protein [Amycolatopsis sp. FDAARGOS 1241]QRP47421.1 hypothetical protein I6J71_05485 [Amycolatopsis sp. FDAARGOS 1241]